MRYKEPQFEHELKNSNKILQLMAKDFEYISKEIIGVDPMVTRVWDKIKGSSGVHFLKRAVDFRDEFSGVRLYDPIEVQIILNYINRKWERFDEYSTIIHHSFNGGPKHFHLQCAGDIGVYQRGKNETI